MPWLVITAELLPEPGTAGLAVNVPSHLSMPEIQQDKALGRGTAAALLGSLGFCCLNVSSGAGVRYWGSISFYAQTVHQHLQSGVHQPSRPSFTHTHTHIFIILYIIMCYILYSYLFYNISNQDVCAWYQRPTSAVDTPLNRVLGQVFIQE